MKKNLIKTAAACGLCLTLLGSSISAGAAYQPAIRQLNQQNPFGQQTMQQAFGMNQQQMPFDLNQMDGQMVIREAGDYTLTGEMRGTVFVDPGQGDVRLNLDGARLDGANGPAIVAMSGDKLTIHMPQGSMNSIAGGPQSSAAVYSQIPVFFEGEGRLDVNSQGQDAFRVENGDLSFNGGDIRIDANQNGFNASNVNFNGGTVAMDAVRNDFVPGAQQNRNGGQFDQNWTPASDFMQNQQPSGQFGQMGQDMGQMPAMSGQTNNQMAPAFNNQTAPTVPTGEQNSQQMGQMPSTPGQMNNQVTPAFNNQTVPTAPTGEQSGQMPSMPGNATQVGAVSSASSATEIVSGTTANSAMSLEADYDNATTYDVSENSTVKITDSGTYIVTGSSDDGSITVKKGTTGVVLVLDDLDLTSTSGATLSINKEAEVQVIVSGTVTLTDNENPDDEYSTDAAVADAYDGAAIKVKASSVVFITGDGTLNVNGNAKNGIKGGDDSSIIIGGEDLTVNINATNDGINGNYDVTILSGKVNVSAGDDGIHADHILTIGDDGKGPDLTVSKSNEGLEGTVVNIAGGKLNITSTDDGINAANSDGTYVGELDYAVNITGGDVTVNTKADGIDSNGNVNLVGGSARISSANNGGDAGIDYDGSLYVSDSFSLNNQSGTAGPDNMMGGPGMGGMNGNMGGFGGQSSNGPSGNMGGGFSGGPMGR